MIKNPKKPLTYLLLIAVLGIWGLVLYRLFTGKWQGTEQDHVAHAAISNVVGLPQSMPDTFTLHLNYPDPFTGALPLSKDTLKVVVTPTKLIPPMLMQAVPVLIKPIDEMKYLGYVANGNTKQLIAIISYQGDERMVEVGDTLRKVRVVKIERERLILNDGTKTRLLKTE